VNGYIDDACDKWGDVVAGEPALTLALYCKELSRGSLGEVEVGEGGKGGL